MGRYAAGKLDEAGRKKVLESLVASRAIAQIQLKNLTPEEEAVIDRKVQAYREELLVMRYLAKHAPPQPVTEEMVRKYYESHPERFGGRTIRTYEMVTTSRALKAPERDNLIGVLNKAAENKDWRKWVERLQTQGLPVAFRQGQVSEKVLQVQLRELMRPLKKGESSQLTFIKGNAYLVRIVDETKIAPRPLNEVSAKIRKSLVPLQLKKAVKKASEKALKEAKVSYHQSAFKEKKIETAAKVDR